MALSDLLIAKSALSASEKATATVAKLVAENDGAMATLEAALNAYGNALADYADGDGDETNVARLRKALESARIKVDASEVALRTAQERRLSTLAREALANNAQQWDRAIALADDRQKALESLSAVAVTFAKTWQEVVKLNNDLYGALPNAPDMYAAVLNVDQLEIAVRKELLRLGVGWAFSYPWGRETLPPMMDELEAVPSVFRTWRDQHKGA